MSRSNPKYWQNGFSCGQVLEKIRTTSKVAALISSEDNHISRWDTPPASPVPS